MQPATTPATNLLMDSSCGLVLATTCGFRARGILTLRFENEAVRGGDRLGARGNGDVFDARPALGEARVPRREHGAGLAGGMHEARALEVGQVVDRAHARRVADRARTLRVAPGGGADLCRIRCSRGFP